MKRQDQPAESWPLDTRSALALIVRIRCDIDRAGDDQRELLLADLLCAAWPTSTAQDQ